MTSYIFAVKNSSGWLTFNALYTTLEFSLGPSESMWMLGQEDAAQILLALKEGHPFPVLCAESVSEKCELIVEHTFIECFIVSRGEYTVAYGFLDDQRREFIEFLEEHYG